MQLVEEFTLKTYPKRKKIGIILLGVAGALLVTTLGELFGVLKVDISLQYFLSIIIALVVTVVIHEGLHGLFFWRFSGKATFGHQLTSLGPAFFASSPGSLIPKPKFQMIVLAPQVLTICLLPILIFIPLPNMLSSVIVIVMAFNLGGGCLDIFSVVWLRKFPKNSLIEDTKDGLKVYST